MHLSGFTERPGTATSQHRVRQAANCARDFIRIHDDTALAGLQSCAGTLWLNDESISMFVKLVRVHERKTQKMVRAVAAGMDISLTCGGKNFPPAGESSLFHSEAAAPLSMLDTGVKWENVSSIAIPFNIGNMHWILVHVVGRSRSVVVYDSIADGSGVMTEKVESLFQKWAQYWFVGKWSIVKAVNSPMQLDSYNCGVFVAMAIYDIVVEGRLPRERSTDEITGCRRWLHSCLSAREMINNPYMKVQTV